MATGDILAVEIGSEGWYADVTIEGLSTGGTYDLGWGVNNTTGSNKIIFTVVSKGFDDTGAATTIERLVYGSVRVRKPYPNNADAEETVVGSDVKVRVALSEYIWAKDKSGAGNSGTDVVVNIGSGFYTQGGTPNNAASDFAVTNSSIAPYQAPVANWSWPGYQRITGASFTLRCVAFQRDAQEGRPVRAVKFSATDGTNTVETTVTAAVIDGTMPDEVPVIEYVGTLSTTTLDQGAVITCNFIAYPWIGDSDSLLDSSAGAAQPTPLVGPIELLCDKDGTYGVTMALVDPVGGNDTTGQAYDSAVFDEGTAAPFLTIGKAASVIASYNNSNHSRNDVGAGEIRLIAGSYAWLGSTNTYGTKPKTWLTVTHADSTNRAGVTISSASGNSNVSDMVRLYDVTLTATPNNLFSGIDTLWFDKCALNTAGTGIIISGTVWYVTHCQISAMQLRPFSTQNSSPSIVRGNDLSAWTGGTLIRCYTFIGNIKTGKATTSGSVLITSLVNSLAPVPIGIIAFNALYGCNQASGVILSASDTASVTGLAVVQNIFEQTDDTTQSLGNVAISEGTPIDNVIWWHNVSVGQRIQFGYDVIDDSPPHHRRYWSVKGNLSDNKGYKTDTFAPENGARTGNWPVMWGVGFSGNVNLHNLSQGTFPQEFTGISSIGLVERLITYPEFVNRASWAGGVEGAGDGDYHTEATSPLRGLAVDWVLPYDIDGGPRGATGDTGSYQSGLARVTDTMVVSWDVRARESETLAVNWDVRARVTESLDASWDVRARESESLDVSWDVRSRQSETMDVSWDVRDRDSETLAASWSVRQRGVDSLDVSWDVEQELEERTTDTLDISWSVRTRNQDTLPISWAVSIEGVTECFTGVFKANYSQSSRRAVYTESPTVCETD